jgi:hypothetical protein
MKNIRLSTAIALFVLSIAASSFAESVAESLAFARKTLEFVQEHKALPELSKELVALEKKGVNSEDAALLTEVKELRRRIILAHPALDFDKLLVNLRPPLGPGHMCDQYYGRHSRPSLGLAVLENWKGKPSVKLLLKDKLPVGMTMHPDLSYDGKRVLISFCDHTEPKRQRRRFWIHEITVDGKSCRQLTGTADDKLEGWDNRATALIEDWDPCYLPGGGFAFISTRCQSFGRCHSERYVPAYMLYAADADGSNIRQLSYGEANEWDPSVLNDGRIIYTRWDYINRHDTIFQSLWTTKPDGTMTRHFYGNYSEGPCMEAEARAIPGSSKVISTATAHHSRTEGSVIMINPRKGHDGPKPLARLTPEIACPERRAPRGTATWPPPVYGNRIGPATRAATPWPLSEDLYLMSVKVGGKYVICVADSLGGREFIYSNPTTSSFSPIPLIPRKSPPVLPSSLPEKPTSRTGTFYVQNVQLGIQGIEPGTIKRLRINQIYGQPTRRKPKLSIAKNEILKKPLGTVAVNDDGSVLFDAPAGYPLQIQALDDKGMAVQTMRSLVYLHPGENQGCVGCHLQQGSSTPTTKRTKGNPKLQKIQPPAGPKYDGPLSFARTVQPVLDRYCIGCHGLQEGQPPANVVLIGTMYGQYSTAYNSLTAAGRVKVAVRNRETRFSKAKDYFAHASKIGPMIMAGHPGKDGKKRVELDSESMERFITWLDLNVQFYGDYSHNRVERCATSEEGERALRKHIADVFGPKLASQPLAALVNKVSPMESRILMAPLAQNAGGWGQITKKGWHRTADKNYEKMVALVKAIPKPVQFTDTRGTCSRTDGCKCGCCWVKQARTDYLSKTPAYKKP